MIRQFVFLSAIVLMMFPSVFAQSWQVASPDGSLSLKATVTDKVYLSIHDGEDLVLWDSPFTMEMETGQDFGIYPEVIGSEDRSVDEIIQPVWGIRSEIRDHYNQLEINFRGNYSLILRCYDDGVAWRYSSNTSGVLTVNRENMILRFREDHGLMAQVYDNFQTSYEKPYTKAPISAMEEDDLIALPLLIDQGERKLVFTESDLYDYPGTYFRKPGMNTRVELTATHPRAPKATEQGGWQQFNMRVTDRHPYLAKVLGKRDFPWRCMIIANEDAELADSDLVYKLASPSSIPTDWIRPGKVAWDWWNAWNLKGVKFEAGVNNRTYEYYIDFAAANGLEYIIMDEGWSDPFDLFIPTPDIDVKAVIDYAEAKGVKVILWCVWHTLERQLDAALDQFQAWGVAGIKVDFIDRDDQEAINFYENLAREAADHKLLVDYHGCSKPTGLSRTYPNVINYEGVMGNEYHKFSTSGSPGHDVDIVFTRMIAGPMDYTPGAMRNSTKGNFHQDNDNTMSPGTRCHQLGMYVVYYAPLQMLCDAPTAYEAEPEILELISSIPVTWDETRVLAAELGEYVIMARKKDGVWYLGALNNWTERDVEISLNFLEEGDWLAGVWADGINANRNAEDYRVLSDRVNASMKVTIPMKQGGGALGVIRRE